MSYLIDNNNPQKILNHFCIEGDLNNLESFLEYNNFNNIKILNSCLITLISYYRTYGNFIDSIKLLISKITELNYLDKETDMTPLMLAVYKGNYEIVKILIENKSKINFVNSQNRTAIFYALQNNNEDNYHIIKFLIKNNADLNIEDKWGEFPFWKSIKLNNIKIIKLMISKNVDIFKIYSKKKKNCLHLSIELNFLDISKLLIEKGIDYNQVDINKMKPFDYIENKKDYDFLKNLAFNLNKQHEYKEINSNRKQKNKKNLKFINSPIYKIVLNTNDNKNKNKEILNKIKQLKEEIAEKNLYLKKLLNKERNLFIKKKEINKKLNNLDLLKCKENDNICLKCNFIFSNHFYIDQNLENLISLEIDNFSKFVYDYKQKNKIIFKNLLKKIENTIKELNSSYNSYIYGSYENDLDLPNSDIDIVVEINQYDDKNNILNQLNTLFSNKKDFVYEILYISTSYVPIIKIISTKEFNYKKIDLTIKEGFHYGIECVNVVKNYLKEYKFLKNLILILKHILMINNLNDPYKGGLSSYGLTLMIVSYFQYLNNNGKLNKNINYFSSIGRLFLKFLDYYGNIFNNHNYIISPLINALENKNVYINKKKVNNNLFSNDLFIILDPLNKINNVTRTSFKFEYIKVNFNFLFLINRFYSK